MKFLIVMKSGERHEVEHESKTATIEWLKGRPMITPRWATDPIRLDLNNIKEITELKED